MLHLFVARPLASSARGAERAAAQAAELDALATELDGLGQQLESLEGTITSTLEPAFEELVEGVRTDLARLTAARDDILLFFSGAGSVPDPSAGAALRDLYPFELDDPDRLLPLATARDREAALDALAPLVDMAIVRPRFAELNRVWTSQAAPLGSSRAAAVMGTRGGWLAGVT